MSDGAFEQEGAGEKKIILKKKGGGGGGGERAFKRFRSHT